MCCYYWIQRMQKLEANPHLFHAIGNIIKPAIASSYLSLLKTGQMWSNFSLKTCSIFCVYQRNVLNTPQTDLFLDITRFLLFCCQLLLTKKIILWVWCMRRSFEEQFHRVFQSFCGDQKGDRSIAHIYTSADVDTLSYTAFVYTALQQN